MKKSYTSELKGFYNLSVAKRQEIISQMVKLTENEQAILANFGYQKANDLNKYSENVIGCFQYPLSIATQFVVNKKEYLVPMAIEEASVVAAASKGAKIARKAGGFHAEPVRPLMIGQIQITSPKSRERRAALKKDILDNKTVILKVANQSDKELVNCGGGAKELKIREISTDNGVHTVLHLIVDVRDAMGANAVNTMLETVAEYLKDNINTKTRDYNIDINLKIVSNHALFRVSKCSALFKAKLFGGEKIAKRIMNAYYLAQSDPYRAVTHNKGIMNGIVALTNATGNDSRAIESAAHAYACYNNTNIGGYGPLSRYKLDENANILGSLEVPIPLGTIGGITSSHPVVKIALKILRTKSASELSQVACAVGLAQNFAAMRALADEGIQAGHMKLHRRKNT